MAEAVHALWRRLRAPGVRRPLRAGLDLAVVLAVMPTILTLVAGLGVGGGMMSWREGFARAAARAAPQLAWLSVGTGLAALVLAAVAGSRRHWLRALFALALSAATLGGYAAGR